LAVGSDDTVLIADASASSGLAWGQVGTANLATDAVTNAKIANGAVNAAELAANAVTEAKLDSAVVSKLLPAGTIAATIKSSADTGWLLLDGSTVASAETTYPALWAVVPVSWQSGSSLVLPNMANKMLFGQSTTTLGATGGANSKTIAEANLPTHTHTINHGHAHTITADQAAHSHTISVTVNSNTTLFVYNTENYNTTDYIATDTNIASYYSASDFGMAVANVSSHSHTASGSATSTDPTITVSGGVTNHSGSSGNGGFANSALDVTNAHLAVNFQIKAH
jgi:microcystin-dependent protein